MGTVNESRINLFIRNGYDKIFDNLILESKYLSHPQQMDWIDSEGEKVFERNTWGMFWVYECEMWRELHTIPKMMTYSPEEFEKSLIDYLNIKYKKEFGERPLKQIGNEYCKEYGEI